METEFSWLEVWYIFFGFGYRVNHRSREIHRVYFKHKNCRLESMSAKNSEYVTRRKALKLIKKYNYNGCRWCWPVVDKG